MACSMVGMIQKRRFEMEDQAWAAVFLFACYVLCYIRNAVTAKKVCDQTCRLLKLQEDALVADAKF